MHLLALVIAAVIAQCPNVLSQTKLLRHPDVHGDRVVCTYGGDLWHAPVSGGTATRLTSTPGVELFAKFSPDGRCIAFTGPLPARWGYGVDPDIEVDNDPASVLRDEDKQLQKAVDVLLGQIKNDPPTFPTAPPAPVKTGR
jgi:hypothetical protein